MTGPLSELPPGDGAKPGAPEASAAMGRPLRAESASAAAPTPTLASLLHRARSAQSQLSAQPLPIANSNLILIQKLFGG